MDNRGSDKIETDILPNKSQRTNNCILGVFYLLKKSNNIINMINLNIK